MKIQDRIQFSKFKKKFGWLFSTKELKEIAKCIEQKDYYRIVDIFDNNDEKRRYLKEERKELHCYLKIHFNV